MRLSIESLRDYIGDNLLELSGTGEVQPTAVVLIGLQAYVERPYVDNKVAENIASMRVPYTYVRPNLTEEDRRAFAVELADKIVQFNISSARPGHPGTAWVVSAAVSEYSEVDDKGKPVVGFEVIYEMVSHTRHLIPTRSQAMNSRIFVPMFQKPRAFTLVGHSNVPIASADSLSQALGQYAQQNGDWRLHTERSILYHHVAADRQVHLTMAEVRATVEELAESAILKEGAL